MAGAISELDSFVDQYTVALLAHLERPSESSLQEAYNLGRAAIAQRLGVIDVATIHSQAVLAAVSERGLVRIVERAGEFLTECLAPFEMLNRGFRDSLTELRRLNGALENRAQELAEANETIARMGRERSAFLAEAGRHLSASLEAEETLRALARLAVPAIADWCKVELTLDGSRRAAIAPDGQEQPEGRARLVADLVAHGRTLGTMTLVSVSRDYGPDDLELAEELGRRAGLALDNARLYQESRAAVRMRDEFLSIAAHELRTPVTALSITLQDMDRRAQTGRAVDPAGLTRTVRQVGRLTALINDLVDVGQLREGRLELRREPIVVAELVRELAADYSQAEGGHPIEVVEESAAQVRGDRFRLAQVLANLLDNALKYSPGGGRIRITVSVKDGEAVIAVADEGIGIPVEQQQWVFERFFRATNAPIRNYGGLGLGLHISRDIVERHGGRIWLASAEGQGSTFYVALPIDQEGKP